MVVAMVVVVVVCRSVIYALRQKVVVRAAVQQLATPLPRYRAAKCSWLTLDDFSLACIPCHTA